MPCLSNNENILSIVLDKVNIFVDNKKKRKVIVKKNIQSPKLFEKEDIYNVISRKGLARLLRDGAVSIDGIHGINHWLRVLTNGLIVSDQEDVDKKIIIAFSFLHDSKRESDYSDSLHGKRISDLLLSKKIKGLKLGKIEKQVLAYACAHHSDGFTVDNLPDGLSFLNGMTDKEREYFINTIGACWDADRLDLLRVGVYPEKEYLSTKTAKKNEIISICNRWAMNDYINDLGQEIKDDIMSTKNKFLMFL
tara:strand:- start:3794 stop:4543 length:750 start_codon:yes stop_codon:yes gene_type:complete